MPDDRSLIGSAPLRVAAALSAVDAVGFGLPCVAAIRNLLAGREVPVIVGFEAYGGGPLERLGVVTTVPLLLGFLVVCVLEGVSGWLLWKRRRSGAVLSLILLPAGAFYWWGFDLPFPPLFALVRTAMVGPAGEACEGDRDGARAHRRSALKRRRMKNARRQHS
jgi:hypothetical protein